MNPVLTLQIPSLSTHSHSHSSSSTNSIQTSRFNRVVPQHQAVCSLCFIRSPPHPNSVLLPNGPDICGVSSDDHRSSTLGVRNDEGDGSLEEFDYSFASCQNLIRGDHPVGSPPRDAEACVILSVCRLASCHPDGRALLWDLGQRQILAEFGSPQRQQGLRVRRLDDRSSPDNNNLVYQTRDPKGTVTIHDPESEMAIVTTWETRSRTFCAASPCLGYPNLIALPSEQEAYVTIRDNRVSPHSQPAFFFHGSGIHDVEHSKMYGMVMSLGMQSSGARQMVVCGMENGSLVLHDLLMVSRTVPSERPPSCVSEISLGADPVLSLDLAPSRSTKGDDALVAVAGLAGEAVEIENAAETEKGRVAFIKAVRDDQRWIMRQRARVGIGVDGKASKGMSGVSICRFRPDGRLFAAGGWDRRLRIYRRNSDATPLAILRGHSGSVDAMDWAPGASSSGFIATGGSDGLVIIWRCFNTE